jgi:hypothetical protein
MSNITYYTLNKEKINEYRRKNKEKIAIKRKEYREKNKEKIQEKCKEKILCVCGEEINKNHKKRHLISKKHKKLILGKDIVL